jgi:hypothetical protein
MLVFFFMIYDALSGFSWSTGFLNIFNVSSDLGLVRDYKVLRGTTSSMGINSTRVLHRFIVKRPVNYKTSSWLDLDIFSVRFARRRNSFNRGLYGSRRPR